MERSRGLIIRLPWKHARCILCLQEAPLTEEHVIPKQIGGRLSACFLCKPCNDRLGHEVEPVVQRDPAIRLAVEHLKPQIPVLANRILLNQPYVGRGEGGAIQGRFKSGGFRVDARRQEDGSIIQPTPDARKHLGAILRRQGLDESSVSLALRRFDTAAENSLLHLTPSLAAVKWRIDQLEPVLGGPSLSEQVLLKIAYEFVALHMDEKVYDEAPQMAEIRAAILAPEGNAAAFSIESLTTREYAPIHGLALAGRRPHAVVTICLFGWLLFRVHFLRVAIASPNFSYTCFLDTGEESADVLEETEQPLGDLT